jgi:hypothetical protein
MWRAALVALALCAGAGCHRSPFKGTPEPTPLAGPDSLYWRALGHLDAANRRGSLDSATMLLDGYLSTGTTQPHRQEALVLRQLARDSRQLARVQSLLVQARTDSAPARSGATEAEVRRRDDESVKEIQRLKEELAKANEELERIRKRLAAPKPPGAP